MFYHAKNGTVEIGTTDMDYLSFGHGKRNLILLPGLGDGLKTVRGMAVPFALMYRTFAEAFTVFVFSRKNVLPRGYTTEEMAKDQKQAMDALGIHQADVIGVSMGGMIAQHLAIRHPDSVRRLVLAVTSSRPNPILRESISAWLEMAERRDYPALLADTAERMYSDAWLRKNRWTFPLWGRLGAPRSYDRFRIMAQACMDHNTYDSLEHIQAPTLIIGGGRDRALGGASSEELAAKIPSCALRMYEDLGHGLYEEAGDFQQCVLDFLCDVVPKSGFETIG